MNSYIVLEFPFKTSSAYWPEADCILWCSDHARPGVDSVESMQSDVPQHTHTLLTRCCCYAKQFLLLYWHDWHFITWWHWKGTNSSGAIQKHLLEESSVSAKQFESSFWKPIEIERSRVGKCMREINSNHWAYPWLILVGDASTIFDCKYLQILK